MMDNNRDSGSLELPSIKININLILSPSVFPRRSQCHLLTNPVPANLIKPRWLTSVEPYARGF